MQSVDRVAGRLLWMLVAGVLVLCAGVQARAQSEKAAIEGRSSAQTVKSALQGVLDAFHEAGQFPGATIGYVTKDGASGSISVGMAFTETQTPMTGDHRMMAGSTGKVLFASLFLQLVDEGKLSLDELIATWVGDELWFPLLPNSSDITLRMLLNHTSGLPRYVFNPHFLDELEESPYDRWSPEELIWLVFDEEALFPAGEGWAYADTNFIVAAMITEKVTGQSCYNQIYERIIRPHELWDLVATTSPDVLGLAGGYVDPENNVFGFTQANVVERGRFIINPQFEWAGGGYASTPKELARFAHLLYGGAILSDRMQEEMRTTVPARLGPGTRYGLGMMQRPSRASSIDESVAANEADGAENETGPVDDAVPTANLAFKGEMGPVVGHSGFFPGYLTEMAYYEEHGLSLAIQVNTTKMSPAMNPAVMSQVLDDCARLLIGSGAGR